MEKIGSGMQRLSHALQSLQIRETTNWSSHRHTLACRVGSIWIFILDCYLACSSSPLSLPSPQLGGYVLTIYFSKHNFQVSAQHSRRYSWSSSSLFKPLPPAHLPRTSPRLNYEKVTKIYLSTACPFQCKTILVPTLNYWPKKWKGMRWRGA